MKWVSSNWGRRIPEKQGINHRKRVQEEDREKKSHRSKDWRLWLGSLSGVKRDHTLTVGSRPPLFVWNSHFNLLFPLMIEWSNVLSNWLHLWIRISTIDSLNIQVRSDRAKNRWSIQRAKGWCVRRVDDTDGDHHLKTNLTLRHPRFQRKNWQVSDHVEDTDSLYIVGSEQSYHLIRGNWVQVHQCWCIQRTRPFGGEPIRAQNRFFDVRINVDPTHLNPSILTWINK